MKRRSFLGASTGTAAFLAGEAGSEKRQAKSIHAELSVTKSGKLAGHTLEELRDIYHKYLFSDFLPFMDKYAIDRELGGFMWNVDRDGTRLSTKKRARYEGRATWVYSFLYNKLDPDPKYLKVARKSVEFILKNKPHGDNLWPSNYTREGKPTGTQDPRVYDDIFIANGFSEYSKASGDDRYWNMAKDTMLKCLRIYDRPDYYPRAGADYLGSDAPPFPGARIIGVWMVLLRLTTQMLEFKSDPEVEAVAARCVDAVLNRHMNQEFDLINELINHDLSRPDNDYAQFVYTGHAIETLWMVLYEAYRLKDKTLFDRAAESFKRHVEVAWDDVYGGIFRSLNHVNKNIWALNKSQWAQEEVLLGTLFIIEHTGARWAKEWFSMMFTYIQEKFVLDKYGFPLWSDGGDRKGAFSRHTTRVELFHHPRHLMLNLLCLDRMIDRGGNVSNYFT